MTDAATLSSVSPYVLITAARNEADLLERTVGCVCAQTALPLRWVIVSDASTDNTDLLAQKHAALHPWIHPLRLNSEDGRHFGRKALCFNAGLVHVQGLSFEVVGNLDADVTFEPEYFEYLLEKFVSMPRLGVAGTPYVEGTFDSGTHWAADPAHVAGQCQLFRRACLEQLGGYLCIPEGGIDTVAVTTARMNGWTTESFPEKRFVHHRRMGTADQTVLAASFRGGRRDYLLGNHPAWQVARAIHGMFRRPYLLQGGLLLCGYLWGWAARLSRPVSPGFVAFRRQEQRRRLISLGRPLPRPPSSTRIPKF